LLLSEYVNVGPIKNEPSQGFSIEEKLPENRGVKGYEICPKRLYRPNESIFADISGEKKLRPPASPVVP